MIALFLDARYADYIKSSASIYVNALFPMPELAFMLDFRHRICYITYFSIQKAIRNIEAKYSD